MIGRSSQIFRRRFATVVALFVAFALWVGAKDAQGRAVDIRKDWPKIEQYRQFLAPKLAPIIGRELAADLLWVQVLVYYGNYDSDYRYLVPYLDGIYELAPKFRRAWDWGAGAVTFQHERSTLEEYRLAIDILERAIIEFPDDARFHFTLGVRYFLDSPGETKEERRKQRERGAELIERSMRLPGAPANAPQLAAELRNQLGQTDIALRELKQMILTTDNEKKKRQLLRRFRALAKDPKLADAIEEMRNRFVNEWKRDMPYVHPDFYALTGPRRNKAVDIETVAPVRDLFGVDTESEDEPEEPAAPEDPAAKTDDAKKPDDKPADQKPKMWYVP